MRRLDTRDNTQYFEQRVHVEETSQQSESRPKSSPPKHAILTLVGEVLAFMALVAMLTSPITAQLVNGKRLPDSAGEWAYTAAVFCVLTYFVFRIFAYRNQTRNPGVENKEEGYVPSPVEETAMRGCAVIFLWLIVGCIVMSMIPTSSLGERVASVQFCLGLLLAVLTPVGVELVRGIKYDTLNDTSAN